MRLDAVDEELVRQFTAMIYLARRHHRSPGYYREAGQALLALRCDRPPAVWEPLLREHCGIGRRRAYQLMELAKGKALKTLRSEASARVRKHRETKWLTPKIRSRERPQ